MAGRTTRHAPPDRDHAGPGRDGVGPGARLVRPRVRRPDAADGAGPVHGADQRRRCRTDGRAVRRDGGDGDRLHHEGRGSRCGARLRPAVRRGVGRVAVPRRGSGAARRHGALALLHLHGGDHRGGGRPAGSGRDGLHDRRSGHLWRHPAAARGRCGRSAARGPRCDVRGDPRRRRAHHRHDAAAGGGVGRHGTGGGPGALRRRRAPARHRTRARQGRRARARQRADHAAHGRRGTYRRGAVARRSDG